MSYKGGRLSDGTPLNVAVYRAYRNAGLSHNQSLAITAEVGRENSFSAGTLFGNHTDPAANSSGKAIRNLGMLSWNQGRDTQLERHLNQKGVMRGGRMAQTQDNLNAQAQFSVGEMRSPKYAGKLKGFWGNPNASPEAFARELGKNYVVWAYGQNTIKARGGGRQPFNWKAHDGYRRGYLNTLNGMLGGKESYTPQQGQQGQSYQQQPQADPRLSMSAPQLLATLKKRGGANDIQMLYELANNNGLAGREIKQLMAQGNPLDDIAKQLGLSVPSREPVPDVISDDLPDIGDGYEDFMSRLMPDSEQPQPMQQPSQLNSAMGALDNPQMINNPYPVGDTWQTQNRLSDSMSNESNARALPMQKSSWESLN